MSEIDLVKRYFNALIYNDVDQVRSLFSENTKIHNGYYIDDFIMAEINEFNQYSKYYDLKYDAFDVVKTYDLSGFQHYSVLNTEGKLVFDHCVNVVNGYIVGDESFYQKVTKNKYSKYINHDEFIFKRSIAIWCPYSSDSPKFITVRHSDDFRVNQGFLMHSASTKTDGFYSYQFDIQNDDRNSKIVNLRITDPKFSENSSVYFHGEEHPYFFYNMFPDISGKRIRFNQVNSLIWSVAVFFENGDFQHIEFPRIEEMLFESNIVKAIVTDALDNDWEISIGDDNWNH